MSCHVFVDTVAVHTCYMHASPALAWRAESVIECALISCRTSDHGPSLAVCGLHSTFELQRMPLTLPSSDVMSLPSAELLSALNFMICVGDCSSL